VDGQDVLAVHEVVSQYVARARAGEGPAFVEVLTYRFGTHSEGLRHAAGRDPEEEAAWRRRDPIDLFRARLELEGIAGAAALDALDEEVRQEVADALQFALDSPLPDPAEAFDDLYSDAPPDFRQSFQKVGA